MTDPRGISYDGIAPHYDQTRAIPREAREDVRDALAQLMGVAPPGKVYEPGCGTGIFLAPFHDAGFDVVGVDLSEAMLAQARERLPRGSFLVGDAAHPPEEARGASAVLVSGLLHVVPDWQQVLVASYSMLAPGGVLVCIFGRQETPFHSPLFDQFGETYQKELDAAGYEVTPPAAIEPEIRQFLLELAKRENVTGQTNTQAILTRKWFRDLSFAEQVEALRNRVHSWQQQIPEAEHDGILDRALEREAPRRRDSWGDITEKRIYQLSVVFLRRA